MIGVLRACQDPSAGAGRDWRLSVGHVTCALLFLDLFSSDNDPMRRNGDEECDIPGHLGPFDIISCYRCFTVKAVTPSQGTFRSSAPLLLESPCHMTSEISARSVRSVTLGLGYVEASRTAPIRASLFLVNGLLRTR